MATFVSCSDDDDSSSQTQTTYYTVTFDSDGGTAVEKQTVASGKTATKPADPTKVATDSVTYIFAGWYNGNNLFDFATPITENITLKAKWTETAKLPAKTAGSISYEKSSMNKNVDSGTFINPLTKTGDGIVTYSSSDETVATVNALTGEVTIVTNAGGKTVNITATVADSDTYTYATNTASYTITVWTGSIL